MLCLVWCCHNMVQQLSQNKEWINFTISHGEFSKWREDLPSVWSRARHCGIDAFSSELSPWNLPFGSFWHTLSSLWMASYWLLHIFHKIKAISTLFNHSRNGSQCEFYRNFHFELNGGEWGLMKANGGEWGLMKGNEDEWGLMKANGGEWGLMKENEDEWGFMKANGGEWGLMKANGGEWGSMKANGGE